MPFENSLAHMALKARINKEAPKASPVPVNDDALMAGARAYRENCAVCHGLPGQADTPTSKGMYPSPPHLFKGVGVADDPPGVTYWKVANGIRLTGMPANRNGMNHTELWQISPLLAHADKLPSQVLSALRQTLKQD
jgi:mono/diheme cytochrome c family protein